MRGEVNHFFESAFSSQVGSSRIKWSVHGRFTISGRCVPAFRNTAKLTRNSNASSLATILSCWFPRLLLPTTSSSGLWQARRMQRGYTAGLIQQVVEARE